MRPFQRVLFQNVFKKDFIKTNFGHFFILFPFPNFCKQSTDNLKCPGNLSFTHLQVPVTVLKIDSKTAVFLWNLPNFYKYLFWKACPNDCFWKTNDYGRSINPYIVCWGATKSLGGVCAKQNEKTQRYQLFDFRSLMLISPKFCPIGECNLAKDVKAIKQETNWLEPLIFKTIIIYHYYFHILLLYTMLNLIGCFFIFHVFLLPLRNIISS